MGNLFSTQSGAGRTSQFASLLIVALLVIAYTNNMIELGTMIGGIVGVIVFMVIISTFLKTGRQLNIAMTSQDAVKFAIRELNKILETTPSAINEISRRSYRPILGGGF